MEDNVLKILFWLFTAYLFWSDYSSDQAKDRQIPKQKYGCPKCKSEYQSHIMVCHDCKAMLCQYKEKD